jgi:hypothetical protein
VGAEESRTAATKMTDRGVQSEALNLIRQDAEKQRAAAAVAEKSSRATAERVGEPLEGGVVLLEAFDVQGERELPNFTAPPETKPAKFFRTGNFAQHVGKKVTTRFWASGNAGLVWSLRW